MSRFQVIGTGTDTGRERQRTYEATTAEEAHRQAEEEGTLVSAVVELPAQPPTEAQITTARALGIDISVDVTGDELSDLISLLTWPDKPAAPELQALAMQYGVRVTKFAGRKLLFHRIFDRLRQPGHEEDLAAWFAYRVYRGLVGGKPNSEISSPHDPLIKHLGRLLAEEPTVIESIRGYRGSDLVWFGRWTSPDGGTHEGGSTRTTAYKKTAAQLRPYASCEMRSTALAEAERYNGRPAPTLPRVAHVEAKGKGRLAVLVVGIGIVSVVTVVLSYLA